MSSASRPASASGKLVQAGPIVRLPGAHNGLAAHQARDAGFQALYLSGAAMSASMGLPDLGIISVEDVCFFIRQVSRSSGLPVLVDGDTGYGEALNVMNMVRRFRGRWSRSRTHRRPAIAKEVRPFERQETGQH